MSSVTVVDDEPVSLDVLVRAASSCEFKCQSARSAEQAIQLLERNLTPVVVTDLRMQGRGGVWLVQEIQKRWPEVSIIVVTAWPDQEAVSDCLESGTHHIFLKPVNLDEFRHALEANVRCYQRHRQHSLSRIQLEQTLAKRTKKLRSTFVSAIHSLVRTLEARDPYTSGHSLRVRDYALRLAKKIGLPAAQRKQLSLAAKLHDIGKVGLPENILNKPSALVGDERAIVEQHPEIGERILAPILRNRELLDVIRGHHERFDGQGYPDHLAGESIPILARIISVADCFDALTSTRAYRKALGRAEALKVLIDGAGSQFDPQFVYPFVSLIQQ